VRALLLLLALAPPGPALREVPYPQLEGMAPAVARQLTEVRAGLEAAQKAGQADAAAWGEAARHYHAYGLVAPSEACYLNAQALAPDDFRWPYLRAVLLTEASRNEEALAALELALARPERYYPALVRAAQIEIALGRFEAAAARLEPARSQAGDDPAFLAAAGELALAQGRAQEAASLLTRALAGQPKANRLHYPLAMALRALGRADEARAELRQAGAVGLRPRDPLLEAVQAVRLGEQAHLMEGHQAFRAGDFAAAAQAYGRAFEQSGRASAVALVNQATAEARLGRAEEAIEHLRESLRLEPGNTSALFNLGVLLGHAGRWAEAEPVLRELVGRAPGDAAARFEWGLALLSLGRAAEGLGALAAAAPEPARCAVALSAVDALAAKGGDLAAGAQALAGRWRAGACAAR
jgi:tetratricopeptide (TPR) repeat protein